MSVVNVNTPELSIDLKLVWNLFLARSATAVFKKIQNLKTYYL